MRAARGVGPQESSSHARGLVPWVGRVAVIAGPVLRRGHAAVRCGLPQPEAVSCPVHGLVACRRRCNGVVSMGLRGQASAARCRDAAWADEV
jgi:hypothetical protein